MVLSWPPDHSDSAAHTHPPARLPIKGIRTRSTLGMRALAQPRCDRGAPYLSSSGKPMAQGLGWGDRTVHTPSLSLPTPVKIRDLRPRPQSFPRRLIPSHSPTHKSLEASPFPWLSPVPSSPGTLGPARPHLTEHPTPGGQGQGPGGPGKREEGLPRRSAAPLGKGLQGAARRRRQAPTAGPEPSGLPRGGRSSATGRVAAVACSRAALWGPRKPCTWGAGGMRPPRNGWGRSGSRSPVLTSVSCWCVVRRRRPLASLGRRAPLRARSPAVPQPQHASRSVRTGNSSGSS